MLIFPQIEKCRWLRQFNTFQQVVSKRPQNVTAELFRAKLPETSNVPSSVSQLPCPKVMNDKEGKKLKLVHSLITLKTWKNTCVKKSVIITIISPIQLLNVSRNF